MLGSELGFVDVYLRIVLESFPFDYLFSLLNVFVSSFHCSLRLFFHLSFPLPIPETPAQFKALCPSFGFPLINLCPDFNLTLISSRPDFGLIFL